MVFACMLRCSSGEEGRILGDNLVAVKIGQTEQHSRWFTNTGKIACGITLLSLAYRLMEHLTSTETIITGREGDVIPHLTGKPYATFLFESLAKMFFQ
jgi:hypothetical protein